jgi:hypothetical protein
MQRLFNGLYADRRLILKIALHPIFYKSIWVMFLIKKRDLLFYIEELSITDRKNVKPRQDKPAGAKGYPMKQGLVGD